MSRELVMNCRGFLLGLVLLGAVPFAVAEEIPADQVQVSTPLYFPGDQHRFREGTFTYEIAWQGIPAAEAEISVKQTNGMYEVLIAARTNKVVDVFYKLRYAAAASLSAEDFTPGYLFIDQRENSRVTKASLAFSGDGRVRSHLSKRKSSGNQFKDYDFLADNYTLEPLSAAFLARSLDWEVGQEREFDTFDGKSRYLITLRCVDEVEVEVNGQTRPVWIVEPNLRNLTKDEDSKKLKKALLYVTADEHRDILQVKSEVFVGQVTTKLRSFRPLPDSPVQIAQELSSLSNR
ncbi:DUF3108 domain-containing protein [bacterium]|nr:DUF3108 domain-containing protein [bacterium]